MNIEPQTDTEYTFRHILVAEASADLVAMWKATNEDFGYDTLHFGDPEWLLEYFRLESAQLHAFVAERGGQAVGVVPFLFSAWPLACVVGGVRLGALPLRRLRLLGGSPNIPDDRAVYDALFTALVRLNSGYDAIYIENLRLDSPLGRYLRDSPLIRRNFYRSYSRLPLLRPFVRFQGSFDDYMRKFSAKTRETWRRRVKKLSSSGELKLVTVESLEDVDSFAEATAAVSHNTWQYNRAGRGVRDVEGFKRRLNLAASRGWLRSYLLTCGGTPCCFMVGYQYNGRFYYAEVGYDPTWKQFSVGTVLLLRVLQDLFERSTPQAIDFGDTGEYKFHFATDTYMEADFLLFRRRAYPFIAAGIHGACQIASRAGGTVLDRVRLKTRAKRVLGLTRQAFAPRPLVGPQQ
jgi:hypothetical protein